MDSAAVSPTWHQRWQALLLPLPQEQWRQLWARLGQSRFRRRFALREPERTYARHLGLLRVAAHAQGIVRRRLAPARVPRDGKQTPYRGHPVFVAQHATATCCRKCLALWHALPRGRALDPHEQRYVVAVILRFLLEQLGPECPELILGQQPELFD